MRRRQLLRMTLNDSHRDDTTGHVGPVDFESTIDCCSSATTQPTKCLHTRTVGRKIHHQTLPGPIEFQSSIDYSTSQREWRCCLVPKKEKDDRRWHPLCVKESLAHSSTRSHWHPLRLEVIDTLFVKESSAPSLSMSHRHTLRQGRRNQALKFNPSRGSSGSNMGVLCVCVDISNVVEL